MTLPAQLHRAELDCLYRVSEILSRSLDCGQSVRQVLDVLDEEVGLSKGMVSVLDPEAGDLVVHAVQGTDVGSDEPVRYQPGEGIVGLLLEDKRSVALPVVGRDHRFLDRLGIYDRNLPFIAAPINVGGRLKGVLAVQPEEPDDGLLSERARFVEMVASLIGRSLRLALDVAEEKKTLREERDTLRRTVRHQYGFDNIVGHSMPMRRVFDQIRMVAKWNTTVLIRGETGTGKELIANAIHYNSPRARGPYVRVNCASLPETLLESELFGHEKGAFTGAVGVRKGRFESADGGTLFLDEIGEISPAFQAKLLRVLSDGNFYRVGGHQPVKANVRVIAATHQNLDERVKQGLFREDLFHRLNVIRLRLPPLRERHEDVALLSRHFLSRSAAELSVEPKRLSEATLKFLQGLDFPGNVRQLENLCHWLTVMAPGQTIEVADLPPELREHPAGAAPADWLSGLALEADRLLAAQPGHVFDHLTRSFEGTLIRRALAVTGGRRIEAAQLLGIGRNTITRKIQELGLEDTKGEPPSE